MVVKLIGLQKLKKMHVLSILILLLKGFKLPVYIKGYINTKRKVLFWIINIISF